MRGFSLIELMIVVGIMGILAMAAVPSYQVYTQRARFVEVIAAAEEFKTAVALGLQEGTALGDLRNGMHGVPAQAQATRNLVGVQVENGVITAMGTVLVGDATYTLTPNGDGSIWTVGGTCIARGLCNA
jgi:type IV pilus assembly protein PilA